MTHFFAALPDQARAGNALLCVVIVIGVALVAAIRTWGK